jgi:hypothetical protein
MNSVNKRYSIMSLIMDATSSLLPKVEADLPNFKLNLEQSFQEFEEKFQLFHFFAEKDVNQAPLTDFLSDLIARYAEIRRREILERARELVLSDYHNTMIAAGDAFEGAINLYVSFYLH